MNWVRCRDCHLFVLRNLARRRRWWHILYTCRACCLLEHGEDFWA